MKLIRFIIISFVICALIITGITALLPSKVVVSRAREMSITDTAFTFLVKDISHWGMWMEDVKNLKKINDSQYLVGTQSIQLLKLEQNAITVLWKAQDQPAFVVKIEKLPLQQEAAVVHWSFEQSLHWYPWEKLQSLLNEKIIGYKMEMDLEHLQEKI